MYRILVVDNESLIVDGMAHLIEDTPSLHLEVYKAYSAVEALDWMNRTKIDIALLDIRMPGMSGLELQKEINSQWPRCKAIFLTGYNDFNYVQQALRSGSLDYLLKTDGDERIIQAIEKAIEELQKEVHAERIISQAKNQMERAAPALQREYLSDLLHRVPRDPSRIAEEFEELGIRLDGDQSVMIFIGRVNDWKEDYSVKDRSLLMYALQNVTEELFAISTKIQSIVIERSLFVCFIQPLEEAAWSKTIRFVHGTLELLQETCESLLQLRVSLAASNRQIAWPSIPEQFEALSLMLSRGMLLDTKRLLIQGYAEQEALHGGEHRLEQEIQVSLKRIDELKQYLELGMEEDFFEHFSGIISKLSGEGERIHDYRLEALFKITSMFVAYLNRWELQDRIGKRIDLYQLRRLSKDVGWEETCLYLRDMAKLLFSMKLEDDEEDSQKTIATLQSYIHMHLHGDLSLTRLGEVVGYNPSYLSRFYKQATGRGLSEYIQQLRVKTAQEMLREGWAINKISEALGFVTEPYFYRFFKKQVGMTPHEYREQVNRR